MLKYFQSVHKKAVEENVEAPTFLNTINWLTDGAEDVSLRSRPLFTPQEDSWYSFLLEAESTPG
jgi:hypothetical protein